MIAISCVDVLDKECITSKCFLFLGDYRSSIQLAGEVLHDKHVLRHHDTDRLCSECCARREHGAVLRARGTLHGGTVCRGAPASTVATYEHTGLIEKKRRRAEC